MLKSSIYLLSRPLIYSSASKLKRKIIPPRIRVTTRHHRHLLGSFRDFGSVTTNEKDSNEVESEQENENNLEEEGEMYSREFVDMRVEDFKELYQSDETLKGRIEVILKEYDYHKYNTLGRVPSSMDIFDMNRILLEGLTPASRMRMFNLFFKSEMSKRAVINKREREKASKKAELDEKYAAMDKKYGVKSRTGLLSDNGQLLYGLWHNSLFCRIPENRLKSSRTMENLIRAAMFSKKVIFDFDFEDYMSVQSIRSSMEQIQEAYGANRYHYTDPFDLWFSNFNPNSMSGQYLLNNCMKNLHDGSMITIKNDCFTNYFDKNKLVYLTPDSRRPLTDIVRNDDIYIIGVFNDKGRSRPLTYRKAESMGIRSRCLPLDSHIAWRGGSKSLCMNHVLSILLETYTNGGDWKSALMKCLPSRKVKPLDILKQEEESRRKNIRKKFNIKLDIMDD